MTLFFESGLNVLIIAYIDYHIYILKNFENFENGTTIYIYFSAAGGKFWWYIPLFLRENFDLDHFKGEI